jgi:hypothetical protein
MHADSSSAGEHASSSWSGALQIDAKQLKAEAPDDQDDEFGQFKS